MTLRELIERVGRESHPNAMDLPLVFQKPSKKRGIKMLYVSDVKAVRPQDSLSGVALVIERHAKEKAELLSDTRAAILRARGGKPEEAA